MKLAASSLDDNKALEVVVIDLAGRTSMADYMVIATGTSQRHVGSMAQHLQETLKAEGVKGISVEGQGTGDWVLVDAGDVIVHLFRPEVRRFYDLEKMWTAPAPVAAKPRKRKPSPSATAAGPEIERPPA